MPRVRDAHLQVRLEGAVIHVLRAFGDVLPLLLYLAVVALVVQPWRRPPRG